MRAHRSTHVPAVVLALTLLWAPVVHAQTDTAGWPTYGGSPGGTRYSTAAQITRANVSRLGVAWTLRTGELGQNAASSEALTFEATPILFEGALYLSTAFGKVIALDPVTGRERWTYDPGVNRRARFSEVTSRGVSAWRDPQAGATTVCASRIYIGTIDARLIALDARTGRPCSAFGENGQINLITPAIAATSTNHDYQVTSPPAVVNGVVIVGSSIGDNWSVDTGSGVVRGFDARTGALRWSWDPIAREPGRVGAANAWAPMAADPERDLVFVPTSSPSPDFWGGFRTGDNRWANSVVALRASTGEFVWGFQTVHHDLWDYDLAAQPALVTVRRDGREVLAVAQATKMGSLFLLHRETGEPLFPVEERPVAASTVPGEHAWPTQPFPTRPRPLMPQNGLRPEDAWGPTDADRQACRALIERHTVPPMFTPPDLEGVILYPGNASGTNWKSTAFDPERRLLVLATARLATFVRLVPQQQSDSVLAQARGEGFDPERGRQRGAPYAMLRWTFEGPNFPCNPPPWGMLHAVDLATGDVRWERAIGSIGGVGGSPIFGGAIVTAGGLIFMGGTFDNRFRAFDIETGRELWSAELPAAAIATPMTYLGTDGHQYVVTVAGGHGKADLPVGDHVIAYRLR